MPQNTVADFSLPATGGQTFTLSGARGKHLAIYFYPKDNTPGCTTDIIDKGGASRREWRGLNADGHAQEVLDFIKSLN